MSATYQIEPVIDVVRAFIASQLASAGTPAIALPTLTAVMQYPFDPSLCPLVVIELVGTSADWRQFAAGDVELSVDLKLHQIRIRSGVVPSEETLAIQTLCELASAFAANYRLDGNVQNVVVTRIGVAEPDTLHRLGLPLDEHVLFAAATMELRVIWIESCFAAS